jgi:hypothetical protein
MKLNCRPGELAMVVKVRAAYERGFVGHIVRVGKRLTKHPRTGEPGWRIDPPLGGEYTHCIDAHLRPIRPDGITADDVADLYAPSTKETV